MRQVTSDWNAARNDQKLLAELVDIRSAKADDPDGSMTDAAYADAFRGGGIDIDVLSAHEAGAKILARPAPVASALVAALDDWAFVRRRAHPKPPESWERLMAAARATDRDPVRDRLRALWLAPDRKSQREPLLNLAQEANPEKRAAQSLLLLADALSDSDDPHAAVRLLYRIQAVHPNDVWVNYRLGLALERSSHRDEAIRFYTAARAIRPETAHELAHALSERGQSDEAIAVFRDLTRLRPGDPRHLGCLGEALRDKGLSGESRKVLEAASAAGRERIRLKGDDALAHFYLGNTLRVQNKYDEAVAEYRTFIRIKPDFVAAHANLGLALSELGNQNEAITEFRAAIRLEPDYAEAHRNLGYALMKQGKGDEAASEFREAIHLRPHRAEAHYGLGILLTNQGKEDKAIAEYRTAIQLKPDYAEAYCNLGNVLLQKGDFADAVQMRGKGHELGSRKTDWRYPSALWVAEAERMLALSRRLPAVLQGKDWPHDNLERLTLAQMAYNGKRYVGATTLWAEALKNDPKIADDRQAQHRYNAACAAALAAAGKDKPPLDEAAKVRWRKQAVDWMKSELAIWTKLLETGPTQTRQSVTGILEHWKEDPDLVSIRDPASLSKLPEPERKACQALWAEVDALLAKVRAGAKP
jgi:tetratricopeptide (TPR) repeat protein